MDKIILVTGGQGLFGRYLRAELGEAGRYPSREELDVTDAAAVERRLARGDVDWVINCAGTARGGLESQLRANALAAGELARACAAHGAGLVFISTARVFGQGVGPFAEDDPPCPVDDYGLSKYLGERLVARELRAGRYRIVRVSMALGLNPRAPHGQLIPRLLELAARGEPVRAAADQRTSVVHAAWAARMLAQCCRDDAPNGVVHVASRDLVSLYDLAAYVFAGLGLRPGPVPARGADFHAPGLAPPADQGLRSVTWPACGDWRQAADLFIRERLAA